MMRRIVMVCWRVMGRHGSPEVSILLLRQPADPRLNRDYRGIDEPTDVLSFPQEEMGAGEEVILQMPGAPDEPVLLGDVVISLEKAGAGSSLWTQL
jgi:probable rRNA maturation factor